MISLFLPKIIRISQYNNRRAIVPFNEELYVWKLQGDHDTRMQPSRNVSSFEIKVSMNSHLKNHSTFLQPQLTHLQLQPASSFFYRTTLLAEESLRICCRFRRFIRKRSNLFLQTNCSYIRVPVSEHRVSEMVAVLIFSGQNETQLYSTYYDYVRIFSCVNELCSRQFGL